MVKYLFVDTNVLLAFFHFSNDDLEEVRKLAALIRNEEIKLLLPQQVKEEFRRNREVKLADSLQRLRQQRLNLQFPQICKGYPQYDELRRGQREFERHHSELLDQLQKDIAAAALKADAVLDDLFGLATELPRTDEIVAAARHRQEVGNPPGKSGSLGDAINWETVLANAPWGDELHFVTSDGDFYSPVEPSRFNEFLLAELQERLILSTLYSYKSLSEFFRATFPAIQLADEIEKDLLVQRLMTSSSFAETHSIVGKLSRYSEFSPSQAAFIAEAVVTNNQVLWILEDDDVESFVSSIVERYSSHIDADSLGMLRERLGGANEEDEIPF